MAEEHDDELERLLQDELNVNEPPVEIELPNLDEKGINEFVIKNTAKLIQSSIESVEAIKSRIPQSDDAEELEAFSALIKAAANAIDTLNKINLQNKKDETSKELKKMDIQGRKELPGPTTNNILIAPREEVFRRLMESADELIDVTSMEDKNE